jgi:thioredoxin reductase
MLFVETPEGVFARGAWCWPWAGAAARAASRVPGEELGKVIYDVADMESFAEMRLLVVGGGDSAVESAIGLARQRGTTVTLSYRGAEFARVKDRNRAKLEEAVKCGTLRVVLGSEVRSIQEESVVLEVQGREETLPNDVVVVRIGGDPPFKFLEQIGVRIVKKDVPLPQEASVVG